MANPSVNLQRRRHRFPPENPETLHAGVLIVGSGPAGSTFAGQLVGGNPQKRVLMAGLGAQLTARPGANAKNIYRPAAEGRGGRDG